VIGRQVSHFYVIRTLGSGGMGVVYEAQDTRLPRSVAIKFLKANLLASADALRRFKREARLASSLNHPNICTVLEADETGSQSFIVMELLQGRSLKSRLSAGRLALGEILDIGGQVAGALMAAHDQGIIHRDITPGNVFLTESGVVKLLDFGLAKHVPLPEAGTDSTEDVTGPGAVVGTIHYMAPERLADDPVVDYRCDLFSLGAVLYQMATGAPPFDMSPRDALVSMIRNQPEVPLRQLAPEHPVELERIVTRLLEKRPDRRYQSARDLRIDLAALVSVAPGCLDVGGPGASPPAASVAVLRFEIVGDVTRGIEVFRDGLAEDISGLLSAVPGVRVAPRTSTRNLAGLPVREIGRALGTDVVVEGTIQRAGDEVRVAANLLDAPRERFLMPTVVVERPFDGSLAAQSDVARRLCDSLASALMRPIPRHSTPAPDAFNAYQRGRHHWRNCFAGGWRPAIEHFEYAIDCDPEFAPAHVALANAYNFCGFYTLMKPRLSFTVAAKAAERAIAIDAGLASAWRELALARFGGEWDWEGRRPRSAGRWRSTAAMR
jgi:TolB-like protein